MSVEKIIIGYAISDDALKSTLCDSGMQEAWFIDFNAQRAWRAIRTLLNGNSEVNLVTVGALIPEQTIFLVECLEIKPVGQDVNFYIQELKAMAWLRNAGTTIGDVLKSVMKARNSIEAEECRTQIEAVVKSSLEGYSGRKTDNKSADEVIDSYVDELEQRVLDRQHGKSRGLDTGIKLLNESIYGWMPGTLNILAARTSLGKTTLAINFANTAINCNKKVLFFTNEMPANQIMEKVLSLRSGVFNKKIFSGDLNEKDLNLIHGQISSLYKSGLVINDRSGRKLSKFLFDVKSHHSKHGLDLVILDYIQQISVDDGTKHPSRVLELGVIANAIKELSLELKIPIICLAQCNRQAENLDEPPNLSHIRDSGAIEQDADTVLFIHRNRTVAEGKCIIAVAKNRFGPTGDIQVSVDLKVNRFY